MGQAATKNIVNLRNRLTPTLENALKKRDEFTADQVIRHAKENEATAKRLNTKYTDPNALLTGFRRDEHKGTDNEEWLRVSQGLPAHPAPNEQPIKEMNPELLKFLSSDLYVESTTKQPGELQQGRGKVRTEEEENSRPLPSSRKAPGPTLKPTLPKGCIDGEQLREILGIYHYGKDGGDMMRRSDMKKLEEISTTTESMRQDARTEEPASIRKQSRLAGAIQAQEGSSKDDWESVGAAAEPSSTGTLPPGWTEEAANLHIAERYGIPVEDVRTLTSQLNIPEIVRERMGGDISGIWRTRGGTEVPS
ncbi:hypothetical protein TrCOL_g4965 [Triparma columacea]|uniref:Uncharacterized protein n=1 Tax=Triparma columacea TaxID=722753 RepID=A0A9W7GLL2_9STRA|nr:hypothetical protein TrCOL_g4965 [Triparma columacea]